MLNVHHLFHGSRIYGPGLRDVIWFKGCSLHCKGCINPELWSNDPAHLYTPIELADSIQAKEVTLLGGEPLQQADILSFVKELKRRGIGVLLFTGYSLNALSGEAKEAADLCDAVISEPFLESEKDDSLYLMGSRNQKLTLHGGRYSEAQFSKANAYEVILGRSMELHGRSKALVSELLGL